MESEKFNTHLSAHSYELIALWAKDVSLNPVSENTNISDMFSDLVAELSVTLSNVASSASEIYDDFVAIDMVAVSEFDELLEFIFNLVRVDMYICHLVKCKRELNPFAASNLNIQAHNLIKEHIVPILNPEYENDHEKWNEMGVLKAWNSIKKMMLDNFSFEQIVILLDADTTSTLIKCLTAIEDVILNENSDYLDSFEAHN